MADVIMLLAFFSFITAVGVAVAVWANHRNSEAVAARHMYEMYQAANSSPENQEAVFETCLRRVNEARSLEELNQVQEEMHHLFPEINHEGTLVPPEIMGSFFLPKSR